VGGKSRVFLELAKEMGSFGKSWRRLQEAGREVEARVSLRLSAIAHRGSRAAGPSGQGTERKGIVGCKFPRCCAAARYHSLVIRRFYVHNFRCLESFELPVAGQSSVLLIGKNGSGKTTVGIALEILQKIGRGTNRVDDLVKPKDLACGRVDVPMRFEIEVELKGRVYEYVIAFELPRGFKELQVL